MLSTRLREPATAFRALKELGGLLQLLSLLGQSDRLHDGIAVGALDRPEVGYRRLDRHDFLPYDSRGRELLGAPERTPGSAWHGSGRARAMPCRYGSRR